MHLQSAPFYCTGSGSASSLAHAMGGGGSCAGTGFGVGAAPSSTPLGLGGLDLTNPLMPASLTAHVWGSAMFQWWPAAAKSVQMPVAKKSHPDSNILCSSYSGDGVNPGSSIFQFDKHKEAGGESLFEAARKSVPANSTAHIKLFQTLESFMRMTVVPAQIQNE